MCGICGFSGKKDQTLLTQMGNSIKHRGPDESGIYSDNKMNLCSRRLSIVDIELGVQPAHNEDSSVIVVWNGEIYNYPALIKDLKRKGHLFYSDHSDSEMIVHLYEEYGISFVQKLNGMFAIALWDKRLERLYLIRDRMGIKPLYYYCNDNQICFASEIKSILLHPLYKKKINTSALYSYFSFQCIPGPHTAFQEIYSLSPGSILIFEKGHRNLHTYYRSSFSNTCKDSLPVAVEKIQDLLKDAVHLRKNADVNIGSFLSGGIDSALVTALACSDRNTSPNNFRTFCLHHTSAIKGDLYHKDEDLAFADEIAKQYHTSHATYDMQASDLIQEMDSIVSSFDQPFSASASTFFLAKEASKELKVVLSGDGADELFGSYPLQQLAFPMQYFSNMKRKEMDFSQMDPGLLAPFSNRSNYLENLYEFSNGNEILLSYRLLNMTDMDKALFLNHDVFGEMIEKKSTLFYLKEMFSTLKGEDVLNRSLEYYQKTFLPSQVLCYSDRLTMAHGLEMRSPFLDYRLVDYVNSLPGTYKMPNGILKSLLKKAAKPYLSKALIHREKEGFIPPIHDWMREELKEYITDTLSISQLKQNPYLAADSIIYVLHKYYTDPIANDYLCDIIWNLLMFQKWYEHYV